MSGREANNSKISGVDVVAVHDTWISVDPIQGCPASCAYCYLGALDLRRQRPRVILNPEDLLIHLEANPAFALSKSPVCIGNYTDMLMTPSNRKYLLNFLELFAGRHPSRPICVVTKALLDDGYAKSLARVAGSKFFIFFSQSFISEFDLDIEEGRTCGFRETLSNLRIASSYMNISAVHFWRPFLSAYNPPYSLGDRVEQLLEAGSLASVVVGLKLTSDLAEVDSEMREALRPSHDLLSLSGDEIFFQSGFDQLASQGETLGYPIYRNTSCSISYSLGQADFLGTNRGPLAPQRCLSVFCPSFQRNICGSPNALARTDGELESIRITLGLDAAITQDLEHSTFQVNALLPEYLYNSLCHITNSHVKVLGVTPSKSWMGSASGFFELNDFREIASQDPTIPLLGDLPLIAAAHRMRQITGFVTTLPRGEDDRASVFNRFEHVQRVAWVVTLICGDESQLKESALRYVWLHDLNRWAFAHNSELGYFNQALNVSSYFQQFESVSSEEICELRAFHEKSFSGLSLAAQCALAADMLTGLVEDPLMLITGLNVSPEVLRAADPNTVAGAFRSSALRESLESCARALHIFNSPMLFRERFSLAFARLIKEQWLTKFKEGSLVEKLERIRLEGLKFKSEILRPLIFPVNNEIVCHGSFIRKQLVSRLIRDIGEDATGELMLHADERSIFLELRKLELLPDLDELSFAASLDGAAEAIGVHALVELGHRQRRPPPR